MKRKCAIVLTQIIRKNMPEYYHTRVSPNRSQPSSDFAKFMSDIVTKRESVWDKDHRGKINVGDYLGFITGETGKELIYIFRVKEELPHYMRPDHWAQNKSHTNGVENVDHRGVIVLTNIHHLPKTFEWSVFQKATGIGRIPQGTQRVATKKNLIPFITELNNSRFDS